MKQGGPTLEQGAVFARLKLIFVVMVVLAFAVWRAEHFLASFAAEEAVTHTTLRTVDQSDDARVLRAWEEAKGSAPAKVTFETEKNSEQQTRDAVLTVTASSKKEALQQREQLVTAIQAAYARQGSGGLYDVGSSKLAYPVENDAYRMVVHVCQIVALVILLAGCAMLAVGWKHSKLPRGALYGILATAFTTFMILLDEDGLPFWIGIVLALPLLWLGLVYVLTNRVKRAAAWTEGKARILSSKAVAERHRFEGDTTTVRNLPEVEYEFQVGKETVRGTRITLGEAPADRIDEVLERYAKGKTVPVFYNPANPQECTLEPDAPASSGCLWGGAILLAVVYELVVIGLWNIRELTAAIQHGVPNLPHALFVLIAGGLGLFCLAAGIWNLLHPSQLAAWLPVQGTIVSSEVETFSEAIHSSSSRQTRFHRPVVEYVYQAGGQEYHGTNSRNAGSHQWAEAEAAKYTAGMAVAVHYDPANPSSSSLTPRGVIAINGRRSLIVGLLLLAAAVYAAMK